MRGTAGGGYVLRTTHAPPLRPVAGALAAAVESEVATTATEVATPPKAPAKNDPPKCARGVAGGGGLAPPPSVWAVVGGGAANKSEATTGARQHDRTSNKEAGIGGTTITHRRHKAQGVRMSNEYLIRLFKA